MGGGEKEVAVVATLSCWQLLQEQALDRTSPNTAGSIVGSDIVVVVFVLLVRPAAPSSAVVVDPPQGGDTGVAGGGRMPEPPSVTLATFALPAEAAFGGKNYNVNTLTIELI